MINKMVNRTSIRKYKNKDINEKNLKEIIDIINSSPTSINGHHFSSIVIKDKKIKEELSKIGKLQKHINESPIFIVFNIDLSSVKKSFLNSKEKFNKKLMKEVITSGIVDSVISCTMVQDYCISNDISTCFIGVIRHDIKKAQEILNLPADVYPIIGLTIGYSDEENIIKPKLNKVFFDNNYSSKEYKERQDEYEKVMDNFYTNKYPDRKSRAFYEQIRRFYCEDSILCEWIDLDTIDDIFDKSI